MRKLTIVIIITVAGILALLAQLLFGNYLSARLSTLPGMRNLNLFNPRAPIVVTNKETVRVSDANDAVETTNGIKSKLSVVVYYEGTGANTHLVMGGGALNWTSDGYFVTSKSAMAVPNKTYAVILSNGDIFPIKEVFVDPASSLVLFSADARNLSTAEPIIGNDLRPGEKILLILNSISANKTTFLESYMRTFANDVAGQEFNSDRDQRTLSIQNIGILAPGQAAINLDGKLAGMWDGSSVISSDAIRLFANNFFRDNKQILRPAYGFSFKQISSSEARALQLTIGAQVTQVTAGSPAAQAGLAKGDIITKISNKKWDEEVLLQSVLISFTPGEQVTMEVMRNGETVMLSLTPNILE